MSNNQNEDIENEYALSSDDDSDRGSESESEGESDESSEEDEAEILARLRSRKKKAAENISLAVADEIEDGNVKTSEDTDDVFIMSSSRNSHSASNEVDTVDVLDNTEVDIIADTHHKEERSDTIKDDDIDDESVDVLSNDEDDDYNKESVSNTNIVTAPVIDKESEIIEDIDVDSVLDEQNVAVTEEIIDESEENSSDYMKHSVTDNSGAQDSIEQKSDSCGEQMSRIHDDIVDIVEEVIGSASVDQFHGAGHVTVSDDVFEQENSKMSSTENEVEESSFLASSVSIVVNKVERAEKFDTVTYEDPLCDSTGEVLSEHNKMIHCNEQVDTKHNVRDDCISIPSGKDTIMQSRDNEDNDDSTPLFSNSADQDEETTSPIPNKVNEDLNKVDTVALKVVSGKKEREDYEDDIFSEAAFDDDDDIESLDTKRKNQNKGDRHADSREEGSDQQHKCVERDSGRQEPTESFSSPQSKIDHSAVIEQKEIIVTMMAEVERLRLEIEVSTKSSSELMATISLQESKILQRDVQILESRNQCGEEMAEIKKLHVVFVQAMAAEHQQQVEGFEKKIAHHVQQNEEQHTDIAELSTQLSESDCSFMELDAYCRKEPERQQEAIRLYLENNSSEMEKLKHLHPSIETQTGPDAVLVDTQAQLTALAEANDSLNDDVEGLNYKIEELEGELVSISNDFNAASAKLKNVASTVVNHDDRANLLQFKLQAANDEVDRSNKDYQDMQEAYNTAQINLQKSTKVVHDLRARLKDVESSKEDLVSQITDSHYEVQLLKDEINTLEEANSLLKEDYHVQTPPVRAKPLLKSSENSPEIRLPHTKALRSTQAEEPDYLAHDFVPEPLLPVLNDKKFQKEIIDSVSKTTKKQQASENFRKQQASASESALPALGKLVPKKKKVKKLKKVVAQCDDNSVGSAQSGLPKKKPKKLIKRCHECACRIKGDAKVLPCELRTHLNKKQQEEDEEDYEVHDTDGGASSILDNQYMFRDKYGHRRGEEAMFCTWVCARAWNSKHTPLQHRRTTRQLINIADGYGKDL